MNLLNTIYIIYKSHILIIDLFLIIERVTNQILKGIEKTKKI